MKHDLKGTPIIYKLEKLAWYCTKCKEEIYDFDEVDTHLYGKHNMEGTIVYDQK